MVAAVFAIVVVALFFIAVAIGLAWFIAIPVAVVLLMLPAAYVIALFTRPKGSGASTGTKDASYQPISDPKHPGSMPR